MTRHQGFTLIELLVTLAILGLLSMLVIPVSQAVVQRRQEQELRTALRDIRQAIDAYKAASDEGHIAKAAGATGYPKNLNMLVEGVADLRSTKRANMYFMRRLPRDPLNPDAELTPAESWGKRSYASEPDAPREGEDVYDIYSRSEAAGLNGIPYKKW